MNNSDLHDRLVQRLKEKSRAIKAAASSPASAQRGAPFSAAPVALFPLGREENTEGGVFHCIRFPVLRLGVEAVRLAEELDGWPSLAPGLPPEPHRWILLDLETLGLTGLGNPLFLVGLACWQGEELEIVQLFARKLEEEAAVVEAARGWLARYQGLVTFNGRSFDWPYLCQRWQHHHLEPPSVENHVDVLLLARERLGSRYGDCRLQTLETHLCQRSRSEDIPSALIPQAYQRYLATGQRGEIERILYHNALDLLTTAELLVHFNKRLR